MPPQYTNSTALVWGPCMTSASPFSISPHWTLESLACSSNTGQKLPSVFNCTCERHCKFFQTKTKCWMPHLLGPSYSLCTESKYCSEVLLIYTVSAVHCSLCKNPTVHCSLCKKHTICTVNTVVHFGNQELCMINCWPATNLHCQQSPQILH